VNSVTVVVTLAGDTLTLLETTVVVVLTTVSAAVVLLLLDVVVVVVCIRLFVVDTEEAISGTSLIVV